MPLQKRNLLITRATHGILNWLTQLSIYPIRFGPIETLTSMEHLVLSLNWNFGKASFPRFRTFINVLQTFTPNFPISSIPLHSRIRRSTTNLQCWLSRLDHQVKISKILFQSTLNSQLSLAQAINGYTLTYQVFVSIHHENLVLSMGRFKRFPHFLPHSIN